MNLSVELTTCALAGAGTASESERGFSLTALPPLESAAEPSAPSSSDSTKQPSGTRLGSLRMNHGNQKILKLHVTKGTKRKGF